MTLQNHYRLASLLAIIPGFLSVKEGGSVLLGLATKDYIVLPWLVWYNVVLGIASILAGVGIWNKRERIIRPATTILALHGLVLMILLVLFAFSTPVSLISIMAMSFRAIIWMVIVMFLRSKDKQKS